MKELEYPFDSKTILSKKKSLKRQLLADGRERFPKKIAILGGSTTSDIVRCMELFLLDAGILPAFFECEYGQYEQEALFPSRQLLDFAPDLIFIHTSGRNIREWPAMTDSQEAVERKLRAEADRFTRIWENLAGTFHCPVIQNNFEMPWYRLLGNADISDWRGRSHFTARLNLLFSQYAAQHDSFYICDLGFAAADYGLKEWANPYYWNMYKYCMCFDAIPEFAFTVSNIIKSIFGRNKKALALDLDNTLWGGVVGDDGVTGIEIGQETGVAQTYYEFQQYIKSLKDLGIILTVCSKNDEENALDGLRHPEGALSPDDFVIIKANWDNKDRNIAAIASELNILPESIVFVDDNPAEREIVMAQLPGTRAPQMDSVENYIINLDRSGFFETTSLNADDIKRNEMYMENARRSAAQAAFSDYGEYLKSLEMKGEIGDFLPIYIPRITQLTNKSNQFNLTTRRYSQQEMEEIFASPDYIRLYGKLTDKFGDNGVVSVCIGRIDGQTLHIELLLMSCRVLKRDMEYAMLDSLVQQCVLRGITTVRGYYFPTKKNGMVKDLYADFGFTRVADASAEPAEGNFADGGVAGASGVASNNGTTDEGSKIAGSTDEAGAESRAETGATVWELQTAGYKKKNRYIEIV